MQEEILNEEKADEEDDFSNISSSVTDDITTPAENVETEEKPSSKKIGKKIVISAICVVGILAAAYAGGVVYYKDRFFRGTRINGFGCSNMTVEEAKQKIVDRVSDYTYTLKERGGKTETISGKDVELKLETIGDLTVPKQNQNPLKWVFPGNAKHQSVNIIVTLNEEALFNKVKELECIQESKSNMQGVTELVKYKDGKFIVDEEVEPEETEVTPIRLKETTTVFPGGKPITVIDSNKNIVSESRLFEAVKDGMYGLYPDMDLDVEECYVTRAEESTMKQALETMNKYVSAKVSYQNGDEIIPLDGGSINEWVSVDDKYNVYLDEDRVAEWVSALAVKFNTVGKSRDFVTSKGKSIKISGGDYGWRINQNDETYELCQIIKRGEETTREPIYSRKAASHEAFDIGKTYAEISISDQEMWFYKDGELIVSSNIVTGNPYAGNATPAGVYILKYKEKDAVLVGEDYRTPVSYWMPFNGGIGMHDATWRGSFGGSIYLGGGSHGCVNLPLGVAEKIYKSIQPNDPVIVY